MIKVFLLLFAPALVSIGVILWLRTAGLFSVFYKEIILTSFLVWYLIILPVYVRFRYRRESGS